MASQRASDFARSTRDLLRRRMHLMHKRGESLAHIQNTNSQYNLPDIGNKIAYKANREGVAERFSDPAVRKSIEGDVLCSNIYFKPGIFSGATRM